MKVSSIHDRFDRLRKIGLSIPPASGLRPNANRKVSDEEIIALARSRFTVQEIAATVGISKKNVHARLKALRTESCAIQSSEVVVRFWNTARNRKCQPMKRVGMPIRPAYSHVIISPLSVVPTNPTAFFVHSALTAQNQVHTSVGDSLSEQTHTPAG